jgi:hypothetical protein
MTMITISTITSRMKRIGEKAMISWMRMKTEFVTLPRTAALPGMDLDLPIQTKMEPVIIGKKVDADMAAVTAWAEEITNP